jgi:hypothetical protein
MRTESWNAEKSALDVGSSPAEFSSQPRSEDAISQNTVRHAMSRYGVHWICTVLMPFCLKLSEKVLTGY